MNADDEYPGRWVEIMADHSASGVWNKKYMECDVDLLPITQDLRNRLAEWTRDYEALDEKDFENEQVDWPGFAARGLLLAQEVKAALPDWTVNYHDEARARARMPPSTWSYEIRPSVRKPRT